MHSESNKIHALKNTSALLLILAMLLLTNLSCAAQAQSNKSIDTPKASETWEIAFGGVSGRFQQNSDFYKMSSSGQATFEDRRGAFASSKPSCKRGSKQIPAESIAEIGNLIKDLDLANSKTRPEKKNNQCQPSLHAGNAYLTLKTGDAAYSFTYCIGFENKLVLSAAQEKILRQIKEKIRALFV